MRENYRKKLYEIFPRWCEAHGFRKATSVSDHGGYIIEAPHTGYRISRIADNNTGTCDPFGALARPAKELYECMRFSLDILHEKETRK